MPNLSGIVSSVLAVVKTAAPFIPGGSAGLAFVESIRGLVDNTKTAIKGTDQEALGTQLDEALAKMNADFQKTIDSLD